MQKKTRILSSNRRVEQLPAEKDSDNVTKLRTLAYGRFTKTLKSLAKDSSNHFQIRKPLNIYMIEGLNNLGRKTCFQRVYILAQNIGEEKLKEHFRNLGSSFSKLQQPDFREYFQRHLDNIFARCEKRKCSPNNFSGLFIVMGRTHTYLMIEAAEDMMANFFQELMLVHDTFWSSSRVFLVEDKIGETLFSSFYSRHSAAININETFPPSTPNDVKQMAVQHFKLKEKAKSLAETLSLQLESAGSLNVTETSKDVTPESFHLPANPYNKLLPEVQRIDLMLKTNKFYRTVKHFAQTYRILQFHQDEDAFIWPIQNNCMPLDIFKRSQFDVNLTFGNYGQEGHTQNQDNDSNDVKVEPTYASVL